jgi:hypothetical protein
LEYEDGGTGNGYSPVYRQNLMAVLDDDEGRQPCEILIRYKLVYVELSSMHYFKFGLSSIHFRFQNLIKSIGSSRCVQSSSTISGFLSLILIRERGFFLAVKH